MNYKKILEGVVNIINTTEKSDIGFANICAYIGENCPELTESEDDRIRKTLIKFHKSTIDIDGIKGDDIVAWLEKQGQEPRKVSIWKHWKDGICGNGEGKLIYLIKDDYTYSLSSCLCSECDYIELSELDKLMFEKQGKQKVSCTTLVETGNGGINALVTRELSTNGYSEQKSANEVEPKFKVGDWIVNNQTSTICLVKSIKDNKYCIWPLDAEIEGFLRIVDVDSEYHLWTIQDAKDGDVLACENGWTCIFKKLVNDETFSSYCFMDNTKWFCETGSECHTLKEEFVKAYNGKIYPATKEQHDLLFTKMKEAGYEWDFDAKELKKIDENSFESDRVVKAMRKAGYEWSEETHQLKKIVQKSAWCPSKKQMESLKDMLKYNIGVFDYQKFMEVNSLYEDLKKILDYETDRQR